MTPDFQLIRDCEELAAKAYEHTTIEAMHTDTGVLLDEGEDVVFVCLRGSHNLRDFIQDAKVMRAHPSTPTLWGQNELIMEIHSGILENVESILEELVHTLRPVIRKKIIVLGHSKGGGEALPVALELKRQGFTVATVITFGGLRTFNAVGAKIYNDALGDVTLRVVNQNDIVPRIPLYSMGYRHVGNELFLPATGGWVLNPALVGKIFSDLIGLYGAWVKKSDVLVCNHILNGSCGYSQALKNLN